MSKDWVERMRDYYRELRPPRRTFKVDPLPDQRKECRKCGASFVDLSVGNVHSKCEECRG